MSSKELSTINSEKLRKRKKMGLAIIYVLLAIAIVVVAIMLYQMAWGTFDADRSLIFSLIIPLFMALLLYNGVQNINKELETRRNNQEHHESQ